MTAKECMTAIPGFRFIFGELELLSAPGRQAARALPFMTGEEAIAARLDKVDQAIRLSAGNAAATSRICLKLMQVKDVGGTARRIASGQADAHPLDDVELFEAKSLALLADDLRELLAGCGQSGLVEIPDLSGVVALLDPEGMRVPAFHIYDAYDARLAPLRGEIRRHHTTGATDTATEPLLAECERIELEVRRRLSARLHSECGGALEAALAAVADLDVLIATGRLATRLGLTRPVITTATTRYRQLWNPAVDEALRKGAKRFQPIDIEVPVGTTLITGSNMGGKSVVLKTVALAQAMAQLGLYVPARHAEISPVEAIMLSTGDGQSEVNGLSSYAAEMLRIDAILTSLGQGVRALVLIDEPARTTNPDEGRALVNALVEQLGQYEVAALVTTHYSGITTARRHLRVRGFSTATTQATPATINDHMDYSLYETDGAEVPHEAVRIARILGVSETLLLKAQQYLSS